MDSVLKFGSKVDSVFETRDIGILMVESSAFFIEDIIKECARFLEVEEPGLYSNSDVIHEEMPCFKLGLYVDSYRYFQ